MTARRSRGARVAERLAARRAAAEAVIARLIAEAPPLGAEQRARLGYLCDLSGLPEQDAADALPATASGRRSPRPS